MMSISKFTSKVIGTSGAGGSTRRRVRQLPPNYRGAVDAIERYLMHFGSMDGDSAASLFEDVADLFEQAAADGTPIARSSGGPRGVRGCVDSDYSKAGMSTGSRNGWSTPSLALQAKTPEKKRVNSDDDTARPGPPYAGPGEVVQGAPRAARGGLRTNQQRIPAECCAG